MSTGPGDDGPERPVDPEVPVDPELPLVLEPRADPDGPQTVPHEPLLDPTVAPTAEVPAPAPGQGEPVPAEVAPVPASPEPGHPDHGPLPGYTAESVLPARGAAGHHSSGAGGPSSTSRLGRILLPVALALVSVVALAFAWAHLQSDPSGAPGSGGSVAASSKPPIPTLTESPSASPSPSQTSPTPSASATSPSPSASASESPSASASPSPSASVVDRSVQVVVLNGTRRTGLGAKVAKRLRALGWNVTSVANWRRTTIGETTVFVDGEPAAAATMLDDLPVGDTVTSPLSGMPGNRLVVVVGADYPRG